MSESCLKISAQSLQDAQREDDAEYCKESQRLKERTVMSGEALVEKLDEAFCCLVCHSDVAFLENVNCKSCVSSAKEVYCYPTARICDRTFSLLSRARGGFFADFNVLSSRTYFRLSGPGSLISLTLSSLFSFGIVQPT